MDTQPEKRLEELCYTIPKAELHIHIEGTFEPELMFILAQRNQIPIPYTSVDEIREKYKFGNLQEFLDIYYAGCSVLITEDDFHDLAFAYAKKATSQGLKYAEIFFDPQSHLSRNIKFETFLTGLKRGLEEAKTKFGFESNLIMCFLRHLTEDEAIEAFNAALPYKNDILAIGLDSTELGNPPEKFKNLFKLAKDNGFKLCAHAGEEGSADYIRGAIEHLNIERIDHGIHIMDDESLIKEIAEKAIPLTLCPLSNKFLQCCPDLAKYKVREMLESNLLVMINSDDPAYFQGYIGDNYYALLTALNLTKEEIVKLAKNSFRATFLEKSKQDEYIQQIDSML